MGYLFGMDLLELLVDCIEDQYKMAGKHTYNMYQLRYIVHHFDMGFDCMDLAAESMELRNLVLYIVEDKHTNSHFQLVCIDHRTSMGSANMDLLVE